MWYIFLKRIYDYSKLEYKFKVKKNKKYHIEEITRYYYDEVKLC